MTALPKLTRVQNEILAALGEVPEGLKSSALKDKCPSADYVGHISSALKILRKKGAVESVTEEGQFKLREGSTSEAEPVPDSIQGSPEPLIIDLLTKTVEVVEPRRARDPVIRRLERPAPKAYLLTAAQRRKHEKRLQALSTRLRAGLPIEPDRCLIEWLDTLLADMTEVTSL